MQMKNNWGEGGHLLRNILGTVRDSLLLHIETPSQNPHFLVAKQEQTANQATLGTPTDW